MNFRTLHFFRYPRTLRVDPALLANCTLKPAGALKFGEAGEG